MASSLALLARKLGRFRITFTANGRNDHVTVFTLYLPCTAVFSFVVELSSFALFSRKHKRESQFWHLLLM